MECFGFTLEEIGYEGVTSFETKMRSAGMPLAELPGPPVFVPGIPPEERVRLGQTLVKNRVFGEKLGPPHERPRDDVRPLPLREPGPRHLEGARARRAPVGLRGRRPLVRDGRQRQHRGGAGPRRRTPR